MRAGWQASRQAGSHIIAWVVEGSGVPSMFAILLVMSELIESSSCCKDALAPETLSIE